MTPSPSATRLPALLLLLVAGPAAARVAVLPLSGPHNANLERQLSATICSKLGCVPASSVMTSKKVDWDKVRRARLDGVVVGGLSKSKKPQILEVSFLTPDAQRAYRTRVTIVNGRISSTQLVEIRDGVAAAVRAARAAGRPRRRGPAPVARARTRRRRQAPAGGHHSSTAGRDCPATARRDRPSARGDARSPPPRQARSSSRRAPRSPTW